MSFSAAVTSGSSCRLTSCHRRFCLTADVISYRADEAALGSLASRTRRPHRPVGRFRHLTLCGGRLQVACWIALEILEPPYEAVASSTPIYSADCTTSLCTQFEPKPDTVSDKFEQSSAVVMKRIGQQMYPRRFREHVFHDEQSPSVIS